MSTVLKILIALAVALPLAAFVAGSLVASSEQSPIRERIIIQDESTPTDDGTDDDTDDDARPRPGDEADDGFRAPRGGGDADEDDERDDDSSAGEGGDGGGDDGGNDDGWNDDGGNDDTTDDGGEEEDDD